MCDDRNMTSHTYNEEVAALIHARLPANAALLGVLLDGMRQRGGQES